MAAVQETSLDSISVTKDSTRLAQTSGSAAYGGGFGRGAHLGWALVLFIVLVVVVFVVIVATRPRWIVKHGGKDSSSCDESRDDKCSELDWGKALLWSIVIAIGLLVVFWILYALAIGSRLN